MAKKILVVDDDSSISDLTRLILESAGYACTVANKGIECVQKLEQEKYDLVLLDVAMPSFSGIDVIHALRKKGLLAGQKIVFFTASSSGLATELNVEELGVLDCIKKPFSKKFLLEKIEGWLS
ncbi:MAG: response regulator [Nitrososphaera sp.]|uniref:response regulator n=1 Tax=Nitrososphaera sp. TaxID=1971748 RepID=UPI0017E8E569|nr:response regulator [Nitrososphaera sp.]NWG37708.1 response regulator [Nitrososphaera sp.]